MNKQGKNGRRVKKIKTYNKNIDNYKSLKKMKLRNQMIVRLPNLSNYFSKVSMSFMRTE